MTSSAGISLDDVERLSEQRKGHGYLLLTIWMQVRFIDDRARQFCQEIEDAEGTNHTGPLPLSLVKLCGEIRDVLQWRNHPKDWEVFAIKRVVRGARGKIFVSGVGLPAGIGHTDAGILLTLDYIGSRGRPMLENAMEQFRLTDREVMVVQNLLKGWTNKQIAKELNITEQTVKEHLKHIMEKSHTTTRTAILVALSRLGGLDSRRSCG